jgi:hypothetical protein
MAVFDSNIEEFIDDYVAALRQNTAAVFLGAGMSKTCGYVDWAELMKPVAKHLELDVARETDYALLAQYYVNDERNRGKLNKLLFNSMTPDKAVCSDRHAILARLPVSVYWTTNYDELMEKALEAEGKKIDVKTCISNFLTPLAGSDATLYKMHGEASNIHNVIITRRDYEGYDEKYWIFSGQFKCHYVSKTFLFIGFSFSDPNINFLLGQVKNRHKENMPVHFYITKKEEDAYLKKRQKHQIAFLQTYGIKTVLIEDYLMLVPVLKEIEDRYNRKYVLIAGSADGYGEWNARRAELFLYHLGYQLRKKGYELVSQMGNNVGRLVMQGANKWEQDIVGRYKAWTQKILPPPTGDDADFTSLSYSGIGTCIYLFGNEKEDGEPVDTRTWEQELNAFRRSGLNIVPVASTGFAARRMWKKISDFPEIYGHCLKYESQTEDTGIFNSLGIPYEEKEIPANDFTDYLGKPELLPDYGLIQTIIRALDINL